MCSEGATGCQLAAGEEETPWTSLASMLNMFRFALNFPVSGNDDSVGVGLEADDLGGGEALGAVVTAGITAGLVMAGGRLDMESGLKGDAA